MVDLGTLPIDNDSVASAVNDGGEIVGWGHTASGSVSALACPVAERATGTRVSCSPDSIQVGLATTCTVKISDAGTRSAGAPAGSVSFRRR